MGLFWMHCKSENRFSRSPYCRTGINRRWQHEALLKNKILRDDWERYRMRKDRRKRKRGADNPPSSPAIEHGTSLVKEEPPWEGFEPDPVPVERVYGFDPQHGSLQCKLPFPTRRQPFTKPSTVQKVLMQRYVNYLFAMLPCAGVQG